MKRRTALIADDNAEWLRILSSILASEYEIVATVDRGDQVLQAAVALQPDVITLDISMPGISGLNLLPELRAALPRTSIVMVTTTTGKLYREEANKRGADGYVVKHNVPNELLTALSESAGHTHIPER